jgi:hypothetical protein
LRIRKGSASRLRKTVLQPLSSRVTRPGSSAKPRSRHDDSNSSLQPSRKSHRSSMTLRVASGTRQPPTAVRPPADIGGVQECSLVLLALVFASVGSWFSRSGCRCSSVCPRSAGH